MNYLNDNGNLYNTERTSTNETTISLDQLFNFSAEKLIKFKTFKIT